MEQNTALQKVQDLPQGGTFSIEGFNHAQRIATMLSDSTLIPQDYKGKVSNCLIALEMANRIGASPLMVMQNLHVIQGRPSWSSPFIIASLNTCGRFDPLKFKQIGTKGQPDYGYMAYTKDKKGELLEGPEVTMAMVTAEGWLAKNGSKWKTMPELMFRYRAAAFFGRLYAPDVLMGMQTVDEVIDVQPSVEDFDAESNRKDKEQERVTLMLQEATSKESLMKLKEHLSTTEQLNLFETKMKALS